MTLEERVAAGVKLLNEKKPGWCGSVHKDMLEMDSCVNCILGQLFGHYIDGRNELDITYDEGIECGFNIMIAEEGDWNKLKELWTKELN